MHIPRHHSLPTKATPKVTFPVTTACCRGSNNSNQQLIRMAWVHVCAHRGVCFNGPKAACRFDHPSFNLQACVELTARF